MEIVDTHAHLTDPKLRTEAADVVERAKSAGVQWMVTIASDLDDSARAIETAEAFDEVYATVGVHPHAAETVKPDTFERLRKLAEHPRVVALGETGLDYYYENSPRAEQRSAFRRHLELAADLNLPAVVHARKADDEVKQIMKEVAWHRGVLHCFSSGPALIEAALELGWYASFAGMITFPKWDGVDLLRRVPLDRLMVETDSPYLAPVPHRGKRNEPANVVLVAERAALLREEDPDVLARATVENARAFYGLQTTG